MPGVALVIARTPITLQGSRVRLEPLTAAHRDGSASAAADGQLWELWFTSVPKPKETGGYIVEALEGQRAGPMLPWAVRELDTGSIVGRTRYHDISPQVDRVEIGYTWYAAGWQRSHVNSACKLLLLGHAFETLAAEWSGFGPTTSTSPTNGQSRLSVHLHLPLGTEWPGFGSETMPFKSKAQRRKFAELLVSRSGNPASVPPSARPGRRSALRRPRVGDVPPERDPAPWRSRSAACTFPAPEFHPRP